MCTVDSLAWLRMYYYSLYKVHTQLLYTHALVHMPLFLFLQIHSILSNPINLWKLGPQRT